MGSGGKQDAKKLRGEKNCDGLLIFKKYSKEGSFLSYSYHKGPSLQGVCWSFSRKKPITPPLVLRPISNTEVGLDCKDPGKGSMLPPRGLDQPGQQGISHVVLSKSQGSPVPTQPPEGSTNFTIPFTLRAGSGGLGS